MTEDVKSYRTIPVATQPNNGAIALRISFTAWATR